MSRSRPRTLDELTAATSVCAARRDLLTLELDAVTSELKRLVIDLCEQGVSEHQAADLAGVTRMTVRAWRGKPQPRSRRN